MKNFGKLFLTLLAVLVCLPIISHISKPMASTKTYTLSDVQMILRAALHITEPINEYDLNQDDIVNISDARLCLKYVLRILTPSTDTTPNPSEDIPSSAIPATPTPKPTNPTPVPDTPYLSITDEMILGNDTTCAAITLHNITAYDKYVPDLERYIHLELEGDGEDGSPENEAGYRYSDSKSQIFQTEFKNCFDIPSIQIQYGKDYVTVFISVKEEYSGKGKIIIKYGLDSSTAVEYSCPITVYSHVTNNLYPITIMTEDYVTYEYENDHQKKWLDKDITLLSIKNLDGIGYKPATGNAIHITNEGNFQVNYYLPNCYSYLTENITVKETYLTTHGEYDPELTAQVREQLYQKPGYNYPQDQIDFLTNIAEQWYSGEISYRTLRNTFLYTYRDGWVSIGMLDYIDEDGNKHYTYTHYSMNDWGDHGYGQNSKIFKIDGKIDIPTIKSTLNQMAGSWGYGIPGICFVRVHYDLVTNTSYIYFIP